MEEREKVLQITEEGRAWARERLASIPEPEREQLLKPVAQELSKLSKLSDEELRSEVFKAVTREKRS